MDTESESKKESNGWGGKREGAGRKPPRVQAISDQVKFNAREIVRKELDKHVGKIMATYLKLASSGTDPTTTRHAVDKIDPDEHVTNQGVTTINFIQFNGPAPMIHDDVSSTTIDVSPSSSPSSLTFIDIIDTKDK